MSKPYDAVFRPDTEAANLQEIVSKALAKMNPSILKEAEDTIYGDREKTYGDPGKNIRVIADYWVTYLRSIGWSHDGKALDYDDVCNMMVLLKIARLGNTPMHRDSLVDACGYLALAERIKNADQQNEAGTDSPSA